MFLSRDWLVISSNEPDFPQLTAFILQLIQIAKNGKFKHFIDGADESYSNWMRFVNCARFEEEQNLMAFQLRGDIYYRSYKVIPPNTELLVWYGEKCAEDLGISTLCSADEGTKSSE